MFIKLHFASTGGEVAFRAEAIDSFATSAGYTVLKTDGKVFEIRESVDEILATLAGGHNAPR